MRWLAYAHPAFMVCVLALALWVLREGLVVRRARLAGRSHDSSRHRRLARLLLIGVAVGAASGLASMAWIRERSVADSLHFALATSAVVAMASAGTLGLWLERGASLKVRVVHAACGAGGVLIALGAAAAGMAILP